MISLIAPGGVSAYTNGTFFTNNVPNNTTFPGLIYESWRTATKRTVTAKAQPRRPSISTVTVGW